MNRDLPCVVIHPVWTPRYWLRCMWLPLLMLAVVIYWHLFDSSHRTVFLIFNAWAADFFPQIWPCLTLLGDTTVLLCWMSPLLLWRSQVVMALIGAIPAGGLASVILKRVFVAPRPADLLDHQSFHVMGTWLSGHSFPSGHSITAFAALSAVWACIGLSRDSRGFRWVMVFAMCAASAVAMSRMAVGAHWMVDIVAGACIGWGAGLSGAFLTRQFPQFWQSKRLHRLVLAILCALSAGLLYRTISEPEGAVIMYVGAALVCATVYAQMLLKRPFQYTYAVTV